LSRRNQISNSNRLQTRCFFRCPIVPFLEWPTDTIMQERYRMFRRSGGNFYSRDKVTRQSESLGTADLVAARQLLAARNQAVAQPQLNRTMAKAYLSAKSTDLLTRTWADVMEHYSVTGVESTRHRKA
jgi:hypothetical protein